MSEDPESRALDTGATIRIARENVEVDAQTIARRPNSTIDPSRNVDAAGLSALTGLRVLRGDKPAASGITLDRVLAEGGMGIVRLATQESVGREVAVKTLRPDMTDEATLLKLVREAWVTGSLEHPSIVPVYDVRVDSDGLPLIVLKRIQGVHWGELLADPERAKRELGEDLLEKHLRILVQVANAVHFAHSRHIIHRDLKPENVMIGPFGEVYVLDWGLAVSLVPDPSGRLPLAIDANEMAGTPCYMAPEMVGNQGTPLSERTDVYLLGSILFEILEGRPPHDGGNIVTIMSQVLQSEPTFSVADSEELVAVCKKALALAPENRFASAAELRSAIEEFLTHRGSLKLAAGATKLLVELREHVALHNPADIESRHSRILSGFGAIRFGFRAALEAWPENKSAARGLAEATSLVVELELRNGNPHAAATLLSELDSPPERLSKRVERKLHAKIEEDRRRAALERDRDPELGKRARFIIVVVLGALWTISPLFAWYVLYHQQPPPHRATMMGTGFLFAFVLVLVYRGRESFRISALNRGLMASVMFAFVAHFFLELGGSLMDIPEMQLQALKLLLWFIVVAVNTITLERRLVPIAVVLGSAFIVASLHPFWSFHLTAVANLVVMVVLLRLWWPRKPANGASSRAPGSIRDTM